MLSTELCELIMDIKNMNCEMQNVELKKAAGGCPQRLYDTISSFSNQAGGGIIIFGLEQGKQIEITGVYDAQDLQAKVTEQCNQMQPVVRPLFTVCIFEGKTVVSAEIQECEIFEKPCFYKGAGRMRGSFIRVGEADIMMTEYEIYSYEVFKRKIQDELRVVERADNSSIDKNLLDEYLIKLKKDKPNIANLSNEQILQLQGIMDKGIPTVAGMMILGLYPQAFFPQLCITAVYLPGNEMGETDAEGARFIDNRRIEGTIPQMLEGALVFIRRNIRTKTIIDDNAKRIDIEEYPVKAIREVVLNALIHRDYSIHTDSSPIRILMYKNRIEIENPGGLYGRLTIDELGKVGADTRNPFLAAALEILIDTENRYSGIPTIRNEMKKAGLPAPLFENLRGAFRVTLYNNQSNEKQIMDSHDLTDKVLEFCRTPKTRQELAKKFGFSASSYMINRYINPLIERGFLKMTMPEKPKSKNQMYVKVSQ